MLTRRARAPCAPQPGVGQAWPRAGLRRRLRQCRIATSGQQIEQQAAPAAEASNASHGKGQPVLDAGAGGAPQPGSVKTRFIAETLLPTRFGKFRLRGYKHSLDNGVTFTEPTAIICGDVEGKADVVLRVHDACFTSEVLGSLKCDCAEQLQLALEYIQGAGCGLVIYLQQEGRGIGLANKIAAYALQEQGLDTVDANRALGLPDDCREYSSVRNILADLGVASVRLMTNNPRKLDTLTQLGVAISGRIPCQVQAGEFNQGYLAAKRERMDHLLDGSWCYWDHSGEPQQASSTAAAAGGMGLPDSVARASPELADLTHTVELDEDSSSSSPSNSSLRSSLRSQDRSSSSSSRVVQVPGSFVPSDGS